MDKHAQTEINFYVEEKKKETIILIKFFQALNEIEKEKIYLKVATRGTFLTCLKK